MKKRKILVALLAVMAVLLTFMSCSQDTKAEPRAFVNFGDKGMTRALSSQNLIPGADSLYWSYTATKVGGGLTTGQALEKTNVKSGQGLDAEVGPFSLGQWTFELFGYADPDRTDASLAYTGKADSVTLNKDHNSVDVTANFENNVDPAAKGYVAFDRVYLNGFTTDVINKMVVTVLDQQSPTSKTYDGVGGYFTSTDENKFTLDDGVYQFKFELKATDGVTAAETTRWILVLANRTTQITGNLDETTVKPTFNVTTQDVNKYYQYGDKFYVVENTQQAYEAALNATQGVDNAVIILNGDIVTNEPITFGPAQKSNTRGLITTASSNITLCLNGHSISNETAASEANTAAIVINQPTLKLTIVDDESGKGTISSTKTAGIIVNAGALDIQSGNIVAEKEAIKSSSAEASVSISAGKIESTGTTEAGTASAAIEVLGNLTVKKGVSVKAESKAVSIPAESNATVIIEDKKDLVVNQGGNALENNSSNVVVIDTKIFAGGSGTEKDPYLISNRAELESVNRPDIVNKGYHFKLTQDINLGGTEWTPIGNPDRCTGSDVNKGGREAADITTYFEGTFDGNGKTVSGLYINRATDRTLAYDDYCVGLFGVVTGNTTIKNLTVAGTVMNDMDCAAGIVGATRSDGTVLIQNCVNNVTVGSDYPDGVKDAGSSAAGILGRAYSLTGTPSVNQGHIRIEKCTNNGAITGKNGKSAGIVGIQQSKLKKFEIVGCVNNGDVKDTYSAAGILGYYNGRPIEITDCKNTGNITVSGKHTGSDDGYAANIIGYRKVVIPNDNCIITGSDVHTGKISIAVGTEKGFVRAIEDSADQIILDSDITFHEPVSLSKSMILDLNGHTIMNSISSKARVFWIEEPNVSFTIDGHVPGSRMLASAENEENVAHMSYGLVDIKGTADGCTFNVIGGDYSGNTDYGALFIVRGASDVSIYLKGITSTSNRPLLHNGELYCSNISLLVEDCQFTSTAPVNSNPERYAVIVAAGNSKDGNPNMIFRNVTGVTNGAATAETNNAIVRYENCNFTCAGGASVNPDWICTAISTSGNSVVDVISGTYISDQFGAYIWSSGGKLNLHKDVVVEGEKAGAFAQSTNPNADPAIITIDGASVKGNLKVDGHENAPASVIVNAGSIDGGFDVVKNGYIILKGGTYTIDPKTYVAEGYEAVASSPAGSWTVQEIVANPEPTTSI